MPSPGLAPSPLRRLSSAWSLLAVAAAGALVGHAALAWLGGRDWETDSLLPFAAAALVAVVGGALTGPASSTWWTLARCACAAVLAVALIYTLFLAGVLVGVYELRLGGI